MTVYICQKYGWPDKPYRPEYANVPALLSPVPDVQSIYDQWPACPSLRNGDPVFAINSVLHTPLRRPMSQFDNFFDHQTIKLNSFGQGKNYIRFYLSVFSGKISVFLIVQHFFRTILCAPYIGRFHFGSSQQIRTESLINPLFNKAACSESVE